MRQRCRVCWAPIASKRDHVLRRHRTYRGSTRPRSPCTSRSQDPRLSGSTRCPRSSTRTGSCSRPFLWASSPEGLALITVVAIGLCTKLAAPARRTDDPARDDRGSRVRAGRRRSAADVVHRNRSAHHRDPRRGGARSGPADRGRVREDPRVRALRGHRLHRRSLPRDAVHRRHGRHHRPPADPLGCRRGSRSPRCSPPSRER